MLLGQTKVLLVEDSEEDARLVQEVLSRDHDASIRLTRVDRLMAAILALSQESYDVVLLDLTLPDSSGLETVTLAVQHIRAVPIVVMTGRDDGELAAQAIRFGAQDYIVKDLISLELLSRTLRYACERHQLRSGLEQRIRELEAANERFLSLINSNSDAILIIADSDRVKFINPAGERLLAQSAAELIDADIGLPVEGGEPIEVEMVLKDGRQIVVDVRVNQITWFDEPAHLATLRDITERVQVERNLRIAKQTAEMANRMKSHFLANMSHELRTPLNSIIGFADMMLSGIVGEIADPRHRDYVATIHQSGQHLLRLINDLLDLSKAEAGKLELNESECPLGEILAAAKKQIEPLVTAKRLRLVANNRVGDLRVLVDRTKLVQILLNLLSNAVKFTPEGGRVEMESVLEPTGAVRITVTDSGIGIPSEQIPKAFLAFTRIDNAYTVGENQGTGLGLALTKRLIEIHGGTARLRSAVGKGTSVTVTLPANRVIDTPRTAINLADDQC
jgi:signal transduction histidine kinase/DNA-binding NarL/FixJ family response regulator